MKTIGLLGGTGWPSTIGYYKILNQMVNERLGGYHSSRILLKSIDYHDIMSSYGSDHDRMASLLKEELQGLLDLNPDGFMICCNSLHKYYDLIQHELQPAAPMFHALDLTAQALRHAGHESTLLLATQFTMEDGFFARALEKERVAVTIPNLAERNEITEIHEELMQDRITPRAKTFFKELISKYASTGSVVLGCTEFPMVINEDISCLPLFDPRQIQCRNAVDFAMDGSS